MQIRISLAFWILMSVSLKSYGEAGLPNPGPRSSTEPAFLSKEATEAIAQKKFSIAIRSLDRLIDRYPNDAKIVDSYLQLLDALLNEKKNSEVIRRGKELLNLKAPEEASNRGRTYLAEASLNLHEHLDARVMADELLKNHPTTKQTAAAYSIKFQAFLEEKQYRESQAQLDALISFLEKNPLEPFKKMIPEFKMTQSMRECLISHLIKGKEFTEEEINDYFNGKNTCFKASLPPSLEGVGSGVIHEWCESFTYLNHELQRLAIDPFLKKKIDQDLKATFEFTKPISIELSKCYEPLKPAKNKKRHRKRRLHSS